MTHDVVPATLRTLGQVICRNAYRADNLFSGHNLKTDSQFVRQSILSHYSDVANLWAWDLYDSEQRCSHSGKLSPWVLAFNPDLSIYCNCQYFPSKLLSIYPWWLFKSLLTLSATFQTYFLCVLQTKIKGMSLLQKKNRSCLPTWTPLLSTTQILMTDLLEKMLHCTSLFASMRQTHLFFLFTLPAHHSSSIPSNPSLLPNSNIPPVLLFPPSVPFRTR